MINLGRALLFTLTLVLPILLGACASGGGGKNADGTPKDEESVTTTPWNKPASWEGGAGIPGMGGSR